ncbi:hypothetical protein GHA01_24050 [Novacetimonas hansenii]|uniref:Uncharacterized protein n=1 Tax=Novacetimonas hansenii TaxID=436 RepID=A0ABQ0SH65_NOVHA|nr:hypothetical protein Gaha_0208_016 [Novacetimonas hansenii JCM 7643]GBQ52652.1 hypothetical protein AA0243_0099 [Novacetimonas hansenii NRIC 0243]GEC64556.1 hypothetical protein GHA01_24050 [Novacetimonas hansenii]
MRWHGKPPKDRYDGDIHADGYRDPRVQSQKTDFTSSPMLRGFYNLSKKSSGLPSSLWMICGECACGAGDPTVRAVQIHPAQHDPFALPMRLYNEQTTIPIISKRFTHYPHADGKG